MNAYSLVDPHTRQKLDEMLQTWKAPNPGSLETKPVFPHEVTRPIEEALQKARNAAFEQQRRQALRAQQEAASRTRQIPMMHPMYRQTPTPPQLNGQYVAPVQQQYPPMMPQASQPGGNSQLQQAGYYGYLGSYIKLTNCIGIGSVGSSSSTRLHGTRSLFHPNAAPTSKA